MSDLEDGQIYGQEDVFDPANHAEIIREMTSVVPARQISDQSRLNQRQLFKALGINVMRSLLTYLDVKDMMRFTTVCRWVYRFGNDAVVLAHFGAGRKDSAGGGWTSRAEFIENERWKALISSTEDTLRKDVIFDPTFVSVFHTVYINFKLIFFSLFDSRIRIWECQTSNPKLLLSLPGLSNIIDSAVSPKTVALMSGSELLVTRGDWTDFRNEDRSTLQFNFEKRVIAGQVREVRREKAVITSREGTITVFNEALERVREFQWDKLPNQTTYSSWLLVPSDSLPYIVSVRPFNYVVYDIRKNESGVVRKLTFGDITRADVISAQAEGREQHYLLIQTVSRLYANGVVLDEKVDEFAVLKDRLVLHMTTGAFAVYQASISELQEVKVLNKQVTRVSTLLLSVRHYTSVQMNSKDSNVLFFSLDHAFTYTTTISHMAVSAVYGSATDVVLLGEFINSSDKCVTIIRFNRGASKWSLENISLFHTEARRKYLMNNIEKLTAQQEIERVIQRRVEWKQTLADLQMKKEMRKTKWWKQKLRKAHRLFIMEEIQDALLDPGQW